MRTGITETRRTKLIEGVANQLRGRLPWPIRRPAKRVYQTIQMRKFARLKAYTNGMLGAETYKLIYDYAQSLGEWNMIEVGAAHGAATIALAQGAKDAGHENQVVTFEPGEGGSREKYGGKEENISILENNIREYNVADCVSVIPERIEWKYSPPALVDELAPYSIHLHDANASIYCDFKLFYDHLLPGGIVMIDDCAAKPRHGKNFEAFGYVKYFERKGFLEPVQALPEESFYIGMKPLHADEIEINKDEIHELQEQMAAFSPQRRFEFL